VVVIVYVTGTEDRGFESRHGERFFRRLYIALQFLAIRIAIVLGKSENNVINIFKIKICTYWGQKDKK
jgi:hypothetical protein